MNFRFSKCAVALTLALLAASNPKLAQAEEILNTTPASSTEASQAVPVESDTTEEADNTESPVPATTEAENPSSSETAETSDPTSETTDSTASEARTVTPAATETSQPVEGQTVDVRILATTDLHTNLVNYDYYQDKPVETLGLAKTAVLIEEAKKENPNVVLVDNGDTIQGTPLGNYKSIVDPIEEGEQHPMYAALETLGFDVGTLGNHEFNYGLAYLEKVIRTANMPLVNANVLDPTTKDFLYTPYTIVKKTFTDTEGKKVTLNVMSVLQGLFPLKFSTGTKLI